MPKAISYIRFSSSRQGAGSTTERQKAMIHEWLTQHPEVELSSLSEQDLGRSGYKGEHLNHGLGRILTAIEEGKIASGDFILVEAIDRIGRLDTLAMFNLIHSIVIKEVTIVTLEDGHRYSKESFESDLASPYVLIGKIQQANEYSRNLSRRLTAAYERKRRKARSGESIRKHNPYWLTSSGKLIPERAEAVKECINLYLKGYGEKKILLILIEKYPELKDVHPSTLRRWFKNRALIGEWENKNDPIADVYECLIDANVFYQLQRTMKERTIKMSPEQKYKLSGLVLCNTCNKRFYFRAKKYNNTKIVYANCSTYLKRGKPFCDNNRTWPYEVLLEILYLTFIEHLGQAAWDNSKSKVADELEVLRGEIANINKQINHLVDKVVSIMPDDSIVLDRLAGLSETKKELVDKVKALESELTFEESVSDTALEGMATDTNNFIMQALSDDTMLRSVLTKSGYEIYIDGNVAKVEYGRFGFQEFELLRRSVKYNCYIVRHVTPAHEVECVTVGDTNGIVWNYHPKYCEYYAINKVQMMARASTELDLLSLLSGSNDIDNI